MSFKNQILEGDIAFEDLIYDEATKSYIGKDDSATYNFYFENGKLVRVEYLSTDESIIEKGIITNIGTTYVTLPEAK